MYSGFGNIFTDIRKKVQKMQPKITITIPGSSSYGFWPFIFIGRNLHGEDRTAIKIHESVHYGQSAPWNNPVWILRYALQPSYRWNQEKEAYTAEIRNSQKDGININYDNMIDMVVKDYHGMVDYNTAKDFFYKLRDSNPYRKKYV